MEKKQASCIISPLFCYFQMCSKLFESIAFHSLRVPISQLSFFHPCVWPSSQLCDPSHQQLGQHWRELGPRRATPSCVFCAGLCFCLPLCMSIAYVLAHARLASSAQSGFNWLIGTLLTLAVSVVQTQSCSHRLQQVPPLSNKANPLSPVGWRWGNG